MRFIPSRFSNKICKLLIGVLTLSILLPNFNIQPAYAADTCTSSAAGDWNTISWSCGHTPTTDDDVVIAHDVTIGAYTIASINDLTIDATKTLTQNNTNTQTITGILTVNGTLNHGNNTTTHIYEVDFVAASATIGASGVINADFLGFDGGTRANGSGPGAGLGSNSGEIGASGAAYGGDGVAGDNYAAGAAYGSVTAPVNLGSGGGGGNFGGATTIGGAGGGLVILNITGTLTMTTGAVIKATGGNSGCSDDGGGGGSGGSIYITAGTMAGTGTVSANGGNGGGSCGADDGGAGGGGRVALIVTNTISATITKQAYGGSSVFQTSGFSNITKYAGAGTIYTSDSGTTTLLADNNLSPSSLTTAYDLAQTLDYGFTRQISGTNLTVNNVTVKGGARYKIIAGTSITMTAFVAGSTLGSLENEGTLTLPATFSIPANTTLIADNDGTINTLANLTIDASGTFTLENYLNDPASEAFSLTSLTVNGTLNHTANSAAGSTKTHTVNIAATTVTVGSTGSINVTEKGFSGGYKGDGTGPGKGLGSNTGEIGASGAGYGGAGGAGDNYAGGAAYGSTTDGLYLGSGGGGANFGGTTTLGGHGGGAIKLAVSGTLTVTGTIRSNGGSSGCSDDGGGGGSGGSIYLVVGTLTGAGSMTTTGGNGGTNCGADDGGGGGGGRIYVGYSSSSFNSASATAAGGTGGTSGSGNASAGTVTFTVLTPTASTTLYSANADASAGSTNPTNLTTLTPVFSALCDTPSGQCSLAEVEVSANSNFSSPSWQSGQINIADINDGARSENITYAGTQLSYNTTYYWRIKFHNSNGAGEWSTETATFYVPRALELYSLNFGGSVQGGQAVNILWGSTGGPVGETIKLEYSTNDFSSATTIDASEASDSSAGTIRSYSWTVPTANDLCAAVSCAGVKVRISSNTDGNNTSATSESGFTVQGSSVSNMKLGRTYKYSDLYTSSGSATFSGGNVSYVGGSWYNSSWTKRSSVTITNNVASALTDHQVRIAVTYDADMQADFDDIRFTSSDGTTLIDHWLETKVDSTSAVFWVEVPSVASSSTATIYMYYSNSGASSGSNINNTFLAGDNFDGPTLDAEWTEVTVGGASTGTFSSGKWTKSCNGECDWWNSTDVDAAAYITDPAPTATWEAITFMSATTNPTNSHLGLMLYEGARDGYVWGIKNSGGTINYAVDLTGSADQCTISTTTSSAYLKIVKTTGAGAATNNTYNFYRGDNSGTWTQCGSYAPSDIMSKVGLVVKEWSSGTASATFDFFFVKKYATTAPSASIGSEETLGSTTTDQTVVFAVGHTFNSLNTFASTTSGDGSAKFQISNDNGSTWQYCVGDVLTSATLAFTHSNTAAEVTDNCLASLTAGTFNVRSYLRAGLGQSVTLSDVSFNVVTNTAPTASAITPSQTSASLVTFTTTVADSDLDVTSLTVEYSTDNSAWSAATLGTVTQGGAEGDGVITAAGSITDIDTDLDGSVDLTINWAASTDIPNVDDSTVYLRITPNDGTLDGSTATSAAFAVDTLSPTAPGNLTVNAVTASAVTLNFGAATTETNFDAYKIFYKAGASGVTTSDTAFTVANDSDLDFINYNGTSNTTISSLDPNTQYVFKIWAYDTFSNLTPSAGEVATYTLANAPSAPTVTAPTSTSINIVINRNSNPADTEFAIKVGSNYVQANGTLDSTEDWQTYAEWGSGSGQTISGLSINTQYTVSVKARNSNNTETALSGETSAYTLANVPSAPTVTALSSTSLNVVVNQNSNPSTVEYAIKVDSNYLQANGTLDSTEDWQTYAEWGSGSGQTISSLSVNTEYDISVKARNSNNTATALSTETSLYTLANVPSAPTVTAPSSTSLNVVINQNSNSVSTQYAIKVGSSYVQANGSLDAAEAWQTYAQWGSGSGQTVTGLSVNTQYAVSGKARNGNNTATALSSETSLYTLANVPSSPTVTALSSTSLNVVINQNSNSSTVQYAIKVGSSYVQADGTLDSTEDWQTYAQWGSGSGQAVSGLSINTQYAVSVKARNSDSTATALSSETSLYTLANVPSAPTVTAPTSTSINIVINQNSNPSATEYAIKVDTDYVQADGSLDSTEDWQTYAEWGSGSGQTVADLEENTEYTISVKARNGNNTATALSSETSIGDSVDVPGTPTVTATSPTSLTVVIDENSNDSSVEYAIKVDTNYVQTDGTLDSTADWQTYAQWGGATGQLVSGLSVNTEYTISVKARSSVDNETAFSTEVNEYTLSNSASSVAASINVNEGVTVTWSANGNISGTEYYVEALSGSSGNSGWTTALSWLDSTATTRNVNYCYRVKSKNAEGVASDWVSSNCALQGFESSGGGRSGGSSPIRAFSSNDDDDSSDTNDESTETEDTEDSEDQGVIQVPDDVQIVEEVLTVTAKNAGSPEPIEIVNEAESMSLFIPEDTDILNDRAETFVGDIASPTSIVKTPGIPASLSDNVVSSIIIRTVAKDSSTINEEVYFSKPVIVTISLDRSKVSNPANLVAYYYNESEKKYEYVSSLLIASDQTTAAFITYHLSTFVVFELSESEQALLEKGTSLKDIDGHWAKNYITLLFDAGIVNGKSSDRFMPNTAITRAEFVKIALLSSNISKLEPTFVDFKDVPPTHWASHILSTAQKLAIISAFPDNTFKPEQSITRAEALKILILSAKIDPNAGNIPDANFKDVPDDWYKPYVDYAAHNGIITGYSDGTFRPLRSITRAEASKLVVELMLN